MIGLPLSRTTQMNYGLLGTGNLDLSTLRSPRSDSLNSSRFIKGLDLLMLISLLNSDVDLRYV